MRPSGRDDEVLEHQAEDFVGDVGGTKMLGDVGDAVSGIFFESFC